MISLNSAAQQYLILSDGPARLAKAGRLGRGSPRVVQRQVHDWLAGVNGSAGDPATAMEALAWSHTLPRLAECVSREVRQNLLDALLARAAAGRAVNMETDPLLHQLTAGELAWTLAASLPESAACRRLAARGRAALSAGLNRLLDRNGFLHARHRGLLGSLLACWTRCCELGQRLPGGGFGPRARTRLDRLAGNAVRLGMMEARGAVPADRKSAPGGHCEWAATAVLRRDWTAGSPRLTVFYPGQSVELELAAGGELLGAGTWQIEVRRDGELLPTTSNWQQTCWVSDADVDYLELEIKLGDGSRVQRHMAMARKDRFLWLADAVFGDRNGKYEYRGVLPLGPGVEFHGREETREGVLTGKKARAMVLPLALPEWRKDARVGELAAGPEGLVLRQAIEGRRLLAPLFFDLDPARLRRRLTWRQLTVAHALMAQPADVAVGYRIAIGDRQWLIYRSLGPKANRTVLGHNLATETLLARFERSGAVQSIVEIE